MSIHEPTAAGASKAKPAGRQMHAIAARPWVPSYDPGVLDAFAFDEQTIPQLRDHSLLAHAEATALI